MSQHDRDKPVNTESFLPESAWASGDWASEREEPGDDMSAMQASHRMGQANHGGPLGAVNEDHTQLIDASRERSASYGLSESDSPDFSSPRKGDLSDALDENRFLFQHAAPVMETLYDQIANTHSMVLLTSSRGMVLHSLGDADFLEKASQVALTPGMDWSERSKGTNAIGTALSEEEALTVHGNQHFMNVNKFLTCSCSPIFDPYGQVIGALDVTGDHRSFHQHTLALVRMSAQMIENHMFADIFPKAIRIHFHTRAEFLGTLVEGIAVFSPEGRFISANRSAQFQLGLPFSALKAHTFSSLFGIPVSSLLELFHGTSTTPRQLVLHNGVSVWCRASHKTPSAWTVPQTADGLVVSSGSSVSGENAANGTEVPSGASVESGANQAATSGASNGIARKPALSSLRYLNTGDPQIASVIHKLGKVSGRDIPIMILGETGTGKDLLAQAIHGDSNRCNQAFVSVNCASIPETLIESELFGYEEGAFTGARKKGAIGKVQQANGGTLFLDEIGDMPKHLQARLLRVLQERKVSPLGAGKEVDVDVAIICATHKNLKDMIAKGEFREDLYYRLNGLVVKLPALRDRTDFEPVVKRILKTLAETEQTITLSPAVLDLFKRYHWPGNFRQLHNLLRTAVVMVGDDGVVHMDHLPDDFLEEIGQSPMGSGPVLAPSSAISAPVMAATEGHAHAHAHPQAMPGMSSAMPMSGGASAGRNLQDVAITAMADMLRMHKGNVSAAAKALGVSRNTIYRKRHLLPPDVFS